MALSKIRLQQITGSYDVDSNPFAIDDTLAAAATGSYTGADVTLVKVLGHLASAIKRINGAESFTEGGKGKVGGSYDGRDMTTGVEAFRVADSAFVVASDSEINYPSLKIDASSTKIKKPITLGSDESGNEIDAKILASSTEAMLISGSTRVAVASIAGPALLESQAGLVQVKGVTGARLHSSNGEARIQADGTGNGIFLKDSYIQANPINGGAQDGIYVADGAGDVVGFKSNFPSATSILGALNIAAGNLGEVDSHLMPRPGYGQDLQLATIKGGVSILFDDYSSPSQMVQVGDALVFDAYNSSSGATSVTFTAVVSSPGDDEFEVVSGDAAATITNFLNMTLSTAAAALVELHSDSSSNVAMIQFKNVANGTSLSSITGSRYFASYQFANDNVDYADYVAESRYHIDLTGLDDAELDSKLDVFLNGQLMVHTNDVWPDDGHDVALQLWTDTSAPSGQQARVRLSFGFRLSHEDKVAIKIR